MLLIYKIIVIILLITKSSFAEKIIVPMGEYYIPKQTSPLIIQGRVENKTKDRVQGMAVCLSTDRKTCLERDEASAITDGIGEYEMRVDIPGQYTVLVKDEAPEPIYKSGKSDIFVVSVDDLWRKESKIKTIPPIALDLAAVPVTVYFTFTNSLKQKIKDIESVTITKIKSASAAGQDAAAGLLSGNTPSVDDAFELETLCEGVGDDIFSCIILASPTKSETNRFKVRLTKGEQDIFQPVSIDTRGDGTSAKALIAGRTSTQGSPFSVWVASALPDIPDELIFVGRFLDKETRKPIPNVSFDIYVGGKILISGATNEKGRYRISVAIKKFGYKTFKSISKGDISFKFKIWGKVVANFHLKKPPKLEDIIKSEQNKHGFFYSPNKLLFHKVLYKPSRLIDVHLINSLFSTVLVAGSSSQKTSQEVSIGDKFISWDPNESIKVKVLLLATKKTDNGFRFFNNNDGIWDGCYYDEDGFKKCHSPNLKDFQIYDDKIQKKFGLSNIQTNSLVNLGNVNEVIKEWWTSKGFNLIAEYRPRKYKIQQNTNLINQNSVPDWWELDNKGKDLAVFAFTNNEPFHLKVEFSEQVETGQKLGKNFYVTFSLGKVYYSKEEHKIKLENGAKVTLIISKYKVRLSIEKEGIHDLEVLEKNYIANIKDYFDDPGSFPMVRDLVGKIGVGVREFPIAFGAEPQKEDYNYSSMHIRILEAPDYVDTTGGLKTILRKAGKKGIKIWQGVRLLLKSKELRIALTKAAWQGVKNSPAKLKRLASAIKAKFKDVAHSGVLSKKWKDFIRKLNNIDEVPIKTGWATTNEVNADVIIWHGAQKNFDQISRTGFDTSKFPMYFSKYRETAKNAADHGIQFGQSTGIFSSKIPREVWNKLVKKGHMQARDGYRGFNQSLPEQREWILNSKEAIEAFIMGMK